MTLDADLRGASRARQRFGEIVRQADDRIDLAEAALWIAAESCPDLDVDAYRARLDRLAEAIGPALAGADTLARRVERLNGELFGVHGFHGNRDEYYDPRNSYLNEVLDRRIGIPISLCVVYIEVARRLGLKAAGINFPGHFLARVGSVPILVDAFEGRVTTRDECAVRLRASLGADAELTPAHLAPAGNKQILLRMLSNLKGIHAGRRDFEKALGCCDRALLLVPGSPIELRDRGLFYHQLACARLALDDLERYLELDPEGEGNEAIRKLVGQLHGQIPRIH